MIKSTKFRLLKFFITAICVLTGMGLVLYGASDTLSFFYTPSTIPANLAPNTIIRIGGVVENNSLIYHNIDKISFIIIDDKNRIKVSYTGMLPKLFRELQTVVVKGRMQNNQLEAIEILAKHDENYFPPGLESTLKVTK